MTATFACKDIGMNCGFTATANSELELIPQIAQHAKEAHNTQQVAPDLMMKIKAAIKNKGFF